jgi:MFS family permease
MVQWGKPDGTFKQTAIRSPWEDRMSLSLPARVFRRLTPDGWLLFATRCTRLFAYGFLSVVLVLYLSDLGLNDGQIGLLLMLTLLGDTAVSLWITTAADRLGRRRMLLAGALLMALAGVVFALTGNFWLLLLAATVGVISPSGNEVGPFLPIEQAALSQTVPGERRTGLFAWYNLVGSLSTALGSLCGGSLAQVFQAWGYTGASSYRPLVIGYAAFGAVLALAFARLSPAAEAPPRPGTETPPSTAAARFGLHRSSRVVLHLSALFALDAFGGGFVIQTIVAYWFHLRFGAEPAVLGGIFFGANLLAGVSALAAGWLARRFGLVNTMVFTHLPSNALLILVPLMPSFRLAAAVLLLRFSISQMDVPARQSYTMAVVRPEERSAASGVTGVARSVGAALSPLLAAVLLGSPALMSVPFFLAGGLKIIYDLLLYRNFVAVRPAEE